MRMRMCLLACYSRMVMIVPVHVSTTSSNGCRMMLLLLWMLMLIVLAHWLLLLLLSGGMMIVASIRSCCSAGTACITSRGSSSCSGSDHVDRLLLLRVNPGCVD